MVYGGSSLEEGERHYQQALQASGQGVGIKYDLIRAKQIFEACLGEHPELKERIHHIDQLLSGQS